VDLKKLLKKHPKMFLYYDDHGSWTLYKEKPPKDTYRGEPEHDRYVLAEGADEFSCGYVPDIVEILCGALGIKYDSE
jgi:hypothetical protein